MLERLAKVLKKPVVWFVCAEEDKGLLLKLYELPETSRPNVIEKLELILDSELTQSR